MGAGEGTLTAPRTYPIENAPPAQTHKERVISASVGTATVRSQSSEI